MAPLPVCQVLGGTCRRQMAWRPGQAAQRQMQISMIAGRPDNPGAVRSSLQSSKPAQRWAQPWHRAAGPTHLLRRLHQLRQASSTCNAVHASNAARQHGAIVRETRLTHHTAVNEAGYLNGALHSQPGTAEPHRAPATPTQNTLQLQLQQRSQQQKASGALGAVLQPGCRSGSTASLRNGAQITHSLDAGMHSSAACSTKGTRARGRACSQAAAPVSHGFGIKQGRVAAKKTQQQRQGCRRSPRLQQAGAAAQEQLPGPGSNSHAQEEQDFGSAHAATPAPAAQQQPQQALPPHSIDYTLVVPGTPWSEDQQQHGGKLACAGAAATEAPPAPALEPLQPAPEDAEQQEQELGVDTPYQQGPVALGLADQQQQQPVNTEAELAIDEDDLKMVRCED